MTLFFIGLIPVILLFIVEYIGTHNVKPQVIIPPEETQKEILRNESTEYLIDQIIQLQNELAIMRKELKKLNNMESNINGYIV